MTTRQGKKPRKAITDKMKWQSLLYHFGAKCARCGLPLFTTDSIEWDHSLPLGLGGPHDFVNIKPLHAACHRVKTSGTKATTTFSDIGKIAKERRIVRTQKFAVVKEIGGGELDASRSGEKGGASDPAPGAAPEPKPKRSWPSRKMQIRKFGKRKTA
jgi:hypothetical protein